MREAGCLHAFNGDALDSSIRCSWEGGEAIAVDETEGAVGKGSCGAEGKR